MVSSLSPWKSIILMNSSFWEIHQQYFIIIIIIIIAQGYCSLTYINPESLPSPFFQAHSFQFMCEASSGDPLSPLSPGSPFCPEEPWIPGSPFAPFFPSAPGGPWVPFFPGLPRSPLAPSRPGGPGAPGTHVMYVHIPVCPPLLQGGQDGTGCHIVTIQLVTSEKQGRYPCPRSPKDSTNYRK